MVIRLQVISYLKSEDVLASKESKSFLWFAMQSGDTQDKNLLQLFSQYSKVWNDNAGCLRSG